MWEIIAACFGVLISSLLTILIVLFQSGKEDVRNIGNDLKGVKEKIYKLSESMGTFITYEVHSEICDRNTGEVKASVGRLEERIMDIYKDKKGEKAK